MYIIFDIFTHPIDESLVEAVHGSLQLTALVLPLLIVSDRLECGSLPCGGSDYMIHIVHTAHRVQATLPTTTQTHNYLNNYSLRTFSHLNLDDF